MTMVARHRTRRSPKREVEAKEAKDRKAAERAAERDADAADEKAQRDSVEQVAAKKPRKRSENIDPDMEA